MKIWNFAEFAEIIKFLYFRGLALVLYAKSVRMVEVHFSSNIIKIMPKMIFITRPFLLSYLWIFHLGKKVEHFFFKNRLIYQIGNMYFTSWLFYSITLPSYKRQKWIELQSYWIKIGTDVIWLFLVKMLSISPIKFVGTEGRAILRRNFSQPEPAKLISISSKHQLWPAWKLPTSQFNWTKMCYPGFINALSGRWQALQTPFF